MSKNFFNLNCDKTNRTKIVILLGKTKRTIAIKLKNSKGEKTYTQIVKTLNPQVATKLKTQDIKINF